MESLDDFCLKCSNDDIGLTLTFYGKIKFAFQAFLRGEFMELGEYLGRKVKNAIK